jgi:peptidoglycan hydrolase-like protein with peptidoglycan-binding domain
MSLNLRKLILLAGLLSLAASVSFGASTSTDKQPAGATTAKTKTVHHTVRHSKKRRVKVRGQKTIDGDRVREIQQALIREHYLKGQASGKWDDATQAAMHKYQADQGWQSKTIPDSRALIRLGLGPDHEGLLNPESAMTTESSHQEAKGSKSISAQGSTAANAPASINSIPSGSTPVSTGLSDNSPR